MSDGGAGLGAFLRARRDRLTPTDAGITVSPGARRVPGLRHDELAGLAGISPDYYRRLEQGRQAQVSEHILNALADALGLNNTERTHLWTLAGRTPRHAGAGEPAQVANPSLLDLMSVLGHVPVLLLGRRTEILARNAMLRTLLDCELAPGTAFARYMFEDPSARQRFVPWEACAYALVAAIRHEAGRHPDDGALRTLVDEMCAASPEAARWWADHSVSDYLPRRHGIAHPGAGVLEFGITITVVPGDPDQQLVVYTAEPGSPTARRLDRIRGRSGTGP